MSKLIVLKGLPASGKSTYAKELVAQGYKRVNKDELRLLIDDGKWSRENEKAIKNLETLMVNNLLANGFNVVVDDTNFAYEEHWKYCSENFGGGDFEVKFFDVPLMECIERDSKRGEKSVGSKVIHRMYEQYLKPKLVEYNPHLPDCYIFDIDGTLAKMDGRSPYDYTKVWTDKANRDIANMFRLLHLVKTASGLTNNKMFALSGREDSCMEQTKLWANHNDIRWDKLFMRKTGDNRDDAIIKKEIYEAEIKGKYNVLMVFDDRNRVVDMWRSLGITCCQVDYGFF